MLGDCYLCFDNSLCYSQRMSCFWGFDSYLSYSLGYLFYVHMLFFSKGFNVNLSKPRLRNYYITMNILTWEAWYPSNIFRGLILCSCKVLYLHTEALLSFVEKLPNLHNAGIANTSTLFDGRKQSDNKYNQESVSLRTDVSKERTDSLEMIIGFHCFSRMRWTAKTGASLDGEVLDWACKQSVASEDGRHYLLCLRSTCVRPSCRHVYGN